jgi:hypothetical protein
MDERNEISVELNALSALVSGIGRVTPYGVPVGYFDGLPMAVMSRVATGSSIAAGSSILPTRSSSFQVPDGYFDGFAEQVLARIKGGTAGESGATAGKAGADELPPIFSRISRVTPYQVPEGYWGELSPLLVVAHDRSTYRVPEGYFAGLPEQIIEKVANPVTAARVIPMERVETGKVLKGHWWQYSSVAAIAACLLLIFSWPEAGNKKVEGAMTPDVTQALQKVSDQEMQAYLDDQHTLLTDPVNNSTATLDMNEGEVKSLLGEASDNDLQQYMEEHGKAEDLATN